MIRVAVVRFHIEIFAGTIGRVRLSYFSGIYTVI